MLQRNYETGEVIFREGEDSDSVCRILEGRVEVLKEHGSQAVVLGHIGTGEYVGEMGAIEGRPRSATVRAESEVTVEWIGRAAFLRQISENSETALELILRLSERLASLNQMYSETVISAIPPTPKEDLLASEIPRKIVIYGDGAHLSDFLTSEGLAIEAYPFVVGRRPEKGESAPPINVNLTVEDSKPYRMSRVHFAIVSTNDGLQVRDLESTLGTSVNGVFLGRHFGSDLAPLRRGENIITAGGIDSPFRFKVAC